MQHNHSYDFYISEFQTLISNLEGKKRLRIAYILTTIIAIGIWYFRGQPMELDVLNIATLACIGLLVINIVTFIVIERKVKIEASEFVKSGLFDVCTPEQRIEYNKFIERMNEVCK